MFSLSRPATVIVLAVMLTACGFQLRGTYDLARGMSPMNIQSSEFQLAQSLRAQLRANGIKVVADEDAAISTLNIDRVSRSRRVVSVDAQGRAREYELLYRLTYKLDYVDADGARMIEKSLELNRELLFDPETVLAINVEIETLYEEMQLDASRIILRQLQTVK